ncbi:RNA-directed DNA polymerase, eukaryota, reverse transcriptase zinc-binding domain protein [Tanacetum coccineum]
MTRVQAWQEIVEKVKSRLSKWKSKTLSIGGRLTLLKSVLGSIPVFHMSIFKVPSKVLHILESIRSHFFNGHDPGSKKASWVKWNNVLTDKKRGGLGVSSLFALNRGLMIKWVWKFLSQKDSLWTKVIVAIHGVGGKIHSEWTSTGKSCWLSILSEVRSLQRKGMYVFDYLTHKMGNGESTKFWLDHWHTRGIFKDIFPRLYALESSKDVTVSSKIGDTSLVCSFRRIPRGGIEQNQFDSLVELVRSVTIVPSADRWNWNLESTGIFSVASARRRIDEICLPNIGEETRWVKCVPIKINVLAWKIKTDALPTRFNISRRGIDIQDMSCPICDNAIESTDHLFFRCGLVRDIANKVLSWWNLDHANLNSYAEWKSWLVSIRMDSKLKKMFEGVWYSIWWIHENRKKDAGNMSYEELVSWDEKEAQHLKTPPKPRTSNAPDATLDVDEFDYGDTGASFESIDDQTGAPSQADNGKGKVNKVVDKGNGLMIEEESLVPARKAMGRNKGIVIEENNNPNVMDSDSSDSEVERDQIPNYSMLYSDSESEYSDRSVDYLSEGEDLELPTGNGLTLMSDQPKIRRLGLEPIFILVPIVKLLRIDLAECFNAVLVRVRNKPLITMLEAMRVIVMERMNTMRRMLDKWTD